MITRYGRLLAAALALLALLFACAPAQDTPAPPSTTSSAPAGDAGSEEGEEQQPVPILGEFTATGLDGEEVDQSIFTGYDVTMVNVWATFCGPCLSEMPDLGALHQEFSDRHQGGHHEVKCQLNANGLHGVGHQPVQHPAQGHQ